MLDRQSTYYDLLGLSVDCTEAELRLAYRRLARQHHPDLNASHRDQMAMAQINQAWKVLSDPDSRRLYDQSILAAKKRLNPRTRGATTPPRDWAPGSGSLEAVARRRAWLAAMKAQMARLARLSGRSAIQGLLIRSQRAEREDYEEILETLIPHLTNDVESRVRAAKAAGAAASDLSVAATLVAIRCTADTLRREAALGIELELFITAELLDLMWDILGHELPLHITSTLGGNPRTVRAIARSKPYGQVETK